jgi:hypothetical protein
LNLWFQPELRFQAVFLNVDMLLLPWRTFIRIKEEPEAALAKDCRHIAILAPAPPAQITSRFPRLAKTGPAVENAGVLEIMPRGALLSE